MIKLSVTFGVLWRAIGALILAVSILVASPIGAAAEGIYYVQPGDTIDGIAQQFGTTRASLLRLNPLPDPDFIQIGQQLRVPGVTTAVAAPARVNRYVEAPFRSQFDGSREEAANCGPATLGMFMSTFGEHWSTGGIRRSVNTQMGIWDPDEGSTWESLAYAAQRRDFKVHGLYAAKGVYRAWTIDDLLAETDQGRPVMLLVRYWSLPGNENDSWWGDHYILFLGLNADGDVVYHDSAYHTWRGAYRTMSKERLLRAWSRTWVGIKYSAMALRW